jgi:hypothetical protein
LSAAIVEALGDVDSAELFGKSLVINPLSTRSPFKSRYHLLSFNPSDCMCLYRALQFALNVGVKQLGEIALETFDRHYADAVKAPPPSFTRPELSRLREMADAVLEWAKKADTIDKSGTVQDTEVSTIRKALVQLLGRNFVGSDCFARLVLFNRPDVRVCCLTLGKSATGEDRVLVWPPTGVLAFSDWSDGAASEKAQTVWLAFDPPARPDGIGHFHLVFACDPSAEQPITLRFSDDIAAELSGLNRRRAAIQRAATLGGPLVTNAAWATYDVQVAPDAFPQVQESEKDVVPKEKKECRACAFDHIPRLDDRQLLLWLARKSVGAVFWMENDRECGWFVDEDYEAPPDMPNVKQLCDVLKLTTANKAEEEERKKKKAKTSHLASSTDGKLKKTSPPAISAGGTGDSALADAFESMTITETPLGAKLRDDHPLLNRMDHMDKRQAQCIKAYDDAYDDAARKGPLAYVSTPRSTEKAAEGAFRHHTDDCACSANDPAPAKPASKAFPKERDDIPVLRVSRRAGMRERGRPKQSGNVYIDLYLSCAEDVDRVGPKGPQSSAKVDEEMQHEVDEEMQHEEAKQHEEPAPMEQPAPMELDDGPKLAATVATSAVAAAPLSGALKLGMVNQYAAPPAFVQDVKTCVRTHGFAFGAGDGNRDGFADQMIKLSKRNQLYKQPLTNPGAEQCFLDVKQSNCKERQHRNYEPWSSAQCKRWEKIAGDFMTEQYMFPAHVSAKDYHIRDAKVRSMITVAAHGIIRAQCDWLTLFPL